ncbi:GAF domain-containing protein [Lewinella sp. W8]|uniref:GAF domain-containing protein n=1 Tax=Lewinella sp. W8 TaxID=2528208 RepID=UPI001067D4C5|nr:GAF domain-containing protein [Lewinella sp. W8]MTB53417.1 GAF domain-containing protein [Lewinella sp. W8]
MANPSAKPILIPMEEGFVPLSVFQDFVRDNDPQSVYASVFSVRKLIEELEGKRNALRDSPLLKTIEDLKKAEAKIQASPHGWEELQRDPDVENLMLHTFPSFFFRGKMGFIKGPFEGHAFRFRTDALLEQMTNDRWEIRVDPRSLISNDLKETLMAGTSVLNTFYRQNVEIFSNQGMVLRDRKTRVEKHFKFDVQLDYMEVKPIKPLKKLSQQQIHRLLNNLDDKELWLELIPPENFIFEGFVIGVLADVTKVEILSTLKAMAANEGGKSDHESDLAYLETLTRTFLDLPELTFGVLQTARRPYVDNLTWSLLRTYDAVAIQAALGDPKSAYGQVARYQKAIIIDDLRKRPNLSDLETNILDHNVRSLLLAPLLSEEGKLVSILELGAPHPYAFSQLTLRQLDEFISLIQMGTNKFLSEMENSISLTMQQEFTSIHPSVEWKFRQVASKCYWERTIDRQTSIPDEIVFKDVYPLYGQADIVGSSKQRNSSIQADLLDNLDQLHQLLLSCREAVHFHLLDIYAERVKAQYDKLVSGSIASSDESIIVDLLTKQIHPLLRDLRKRFPDLPQEALNAYFDALDPDLDIIYRSRKAYEDSVTQLNHAISNFLLQEEDKMQAILPHYFEKFQTDGVEYNLYLGQSLLEEGEFNDFYLRDFRLWQLILMCEITRLVQREAVSMPVPLSTAQLIFVFNSSLSIRFEMDEKQFDVDGAYNIRYEIIKKRIDKAYIKGTDERLTQAGKIAIVWLQDKDRQEYQEYLDHLALKGYISQEIEDLELEKMQGVEGLKAIRVTVI